LELQDELSDAGTQIPAVFMTGHGDIPMTVRAMEASAVEFLTKPYRKSQLLEAVHAASATVLCGAGRSVIMRQLYLAVVMATLVEPDFCSPRLTNPSKMAKRPKDLIYARDDNPPVVPLIAVGFQHVAVICPYLVMVALVVEAAKLPQEAARNAMGLAMISMAFLTVLQSLRLGPVGSGYLCPPVVSAIYLPTALSTASAYGFPTVCGMVAFVGACEIAVGGLFNSLRRVLFDPTVMHSARAGSTFITALCVLATMTALAVWAEGASQAAVRAGRNSTWILRGGSLTSLSRGL
jgi:hypothetical protein